MRDLSLATAFLSSIRLGNEETQPASTVLSTPERRPGKESLPRQSSIIAKWSEDHTSTVFPAANVQAALAFLSSIPLQLDGEVPEPQDPLGIQTIRRGNTVAQNALGRVQGVPPGGSLTPVPLATTRLESDHSSSRASLDRWHLHHQRASTINYKLRPNTRLYLSSSKSSCPVVVFSVLKYDARSEEEKFKRWSAAHYVPGRIPLEPRSVEVDSTLSGESVSKLKGTSYAFLLSQSWQGESSDREAETEAADMIAYDAFYLDDPDIRSGKHRTVMNLASFMESTIPYVKAKDLGEELNKQFQSKHSWLHPSITLSKIRNLKSSVLDISIDCKLDLATVAMAIVYFEKLVLKNLVTKPNRRLLADTCLLLAIKFNDPNYMSGRDLFFESTQRFHGVSKKEILRAEWPVYVDLGFSLHLESGAVMPHYIRLLAKLGKTPQDYLGKKLYATFSDLFEG